MKRNMKRKLASYSGMQIGFRVKGLGLRGLGFRGLGFRVSGLGFRV